VNGLGRIASTDKGESPWNIAVSGLKEAASAQRIGPTKNRLRIMERK
jgi:hypothetical protein